MNSRTPCKPRSTPRLEARSVSQDRTTTTDAIQKRPLVGERARGVYIKLVHGRDGNRASCNIEITHKCAKVILNGDSSGAHDRTVDREDGGVRVPVDAVAVLRTQPVAGNRRVYRLAVRRFRSRVELPALERAEDDPGRGVVIQAEADVLPRVAAEGRDELHRPSWRIENVRTGARAVNDQRIVRSCGRAACAPCGD